MKAIASYGTALVIGVLATLIGGLVTDGYGFIAEKVTSVQSAQLVDPEPVIPLPRVVDELRYATEGLEDGTPVWVLASTPGGLFPVDRLTVEGNRVVVNSFPLGADSDAPGSRYVLILCVPSAAADGVISAAHATGGTTSLADLPERCIVLSRVQVVRGESA